MSRIFTNLSGQKFGRLTVLKLDESIVNKKHKRYVCKCDCGNTKSITAEHLKDGHIKSCGCFKLEKCLSNIPNTYWQKKHGMSMHKLFDIYSGMKQRCYNKNNHAYKNYGGRGIKVCDEWVNNSKMFFEWALSSGYSNSLSIDRIDNDGNYEPSNCRWSSHKFQTRNRRITWNATIDSVTKPIAEWCEIYGLNYGTFNSRYRKGESVEQALFGEHHVGCRKKGFV
jgi:hypothetical protein